MISVRYVGAEEIFKGRTGLMMTFGASVVSDYPRKWEELVRVQFDDGPDWMKCSWITLRRSDVKIIDRTIP